MEDAFKPQSLSIRNLISSPDSLYQIPRYQRPYSWGDEEIEKLWEDLLEGQATKELYFLGSIITAKSQDKSSYLDIVDGQQRLTTLHILLCVCRDLFPNINKSADPDPSIVNIKTIKSSIKLNDQFDRLRLKTHSNHASYFTSLILDEGESITHKKPLKKELKREEDPASKFKNTANFFTTKLQELGEVETGKFMNYLFNQVRIIRIDCHSAGFAIKLFQVLNDRGLDLSNADLIKSFLIGEIHKQYEKDEELRQLHEDQFMDDWKACETISLDTEEDMGTLLTIYEYYLLAENPKRSLSDELEDLFRGEDPNRIIGDFKKFITHYKEDVYLSQDVTMFSLFYLRWGMYWRCIVLTSLHSNYGNHKELLVLLRRFYYVNWIAGNTLSKIKQISFNIIKWIKQGEKIHKIKTETEAFFKKDNTIKRATEALLEDIYNEAWSKPLLFMLEYNEIDNPSFLAMTEKNIQIEHIVPKAYSKQPAWDYINNLDNFDEWLNTGANLTLLSGKKNLDARNDGFDRKIRAYNGMGNYKPADKKVTSFRITQKIVDDYNSKEFNKEWNQDAMNDRWLWFCNGIEKILDLDLSELKEYDI